MLSLCVWLVPLNLQYSKRVALMGNSRALRLWTLLPTPLASPQVSPPSFRTKGFSILDFITVTANERRPFPAPPDDVLGYSSHSGTLPVAKSWKTELPPALILFFKVQQNSSFLSVLEEKCVLWLFPCPQLPFLVAQEVSSVLPASFYFYFFKPKHFFKKT